MNWTLNDIKKSKVSAINEHLFTPTIAKKAQVVKKNLTAQKPSPQKDWLQLNLQHWANEKGVELVNEYKFHDVRKWRFDWAFPSLKIAIEYEGLFSKKSRHTTIKGYQGDVEKYNSATLLGWKIIRLTAKNYKSVIEQLNEFR